MVNQLKQMFKCESINDLFINKDSENDEENLKSFLLLLNEIINSPESLEKEENETLYSTTKCLQKNFDKLWKNEEKYLTAKNYYDSAISFIKKDISQVMINY